MPPPTMTTSYVSDMTLLTCVQPRMPRLSFGRGHNLHDKRGRSLRGSKRTGYLVIHGRKAPEIGHDRAYIRLRELRESLPGHDRSQHASVRAQACGQSGCNLSIGPSTKTGILVAGQIGAVENAMTGKLETDFRAAKLAGHVRLSQKISRSVAVVAASDCHKILAAFDRRISGVRATQWSRREKARDEHVS
jgi:hypothetical protein